MALFGNRNAQVTDKDAELGLDLFTSDKDILTWLKDELDKGYKGVSATLGNAMAIFSGGTDNSYAPTVSGGGEIASAASAPENAMQTASGLTSLGSLSPSFTPTIAAVSPKETVTSLPAHT